MYFIYLNIIFQKKRFAEKLEDLTFTLQNEKSDLKEKVGKFFCRVNIKTSNHLEVI